MSGKWCCIYWGNDEVLKRGLWVAGLVAGAGVLAACEARNPAEVAIANVVRDNNVAELERYLSLGGDPNEVSRDGFPLIYLATGPRGGMEALTMLLEAGVDPNSRATNGRSVLINAAGWCDTEMVILLLRAGADPRYRSPENKTARDSVCSGPLDRRAEVLNILDAAL